MGRGRVGVVWALASTLASTFVTRVSFVAPRKCEGATKVGGARDGATRGGVIVRHRCSGMLVSMKLRLIAVTCALLLSVTACSGDKEDAKSPTDPSKSTGADVEVMNPLTGQTLKKAPKNPVFVVKIDNTEASAPQQGVNRADLVIEETVEGGITRLAAMYYSTLPKTVGHVRSMRATDIGIAKPINGQIVASGGAGRTIDRIKDAGIPIHSEDAGSPGLSRGPGYAPYNVLADLTQVNKEAKNIQPERPYFVWGGNGVAAQAGQAVSSAEVRFSGSHTTQWTYAGKVWKRANGTSDTEFAAKNLVVLFADEKDAGYLDPAGNPVPETDFVGGGDAVIFLGGQQVKAAWSKGNLSSTIRLKTANGKALKMPAGRTWIELVNKDGGAVTAK